MRRKRVIRHYLDRRGELVEVEQNPCGCCPFDLIITYANPVTHGKGRSVSVPFGSQARINGNTRMCKWERLK